jgi:hypothetical protein
MTENNGIKIVHLKPNAQNMEMWIAYDTSDEKAIGHIFMTIEAGGKIKFLDAWVDETHRRKGVYRLLWETRWDFVHSAYKGYTVYAWCKDTSLPLLLEKGFEPGEIVTYVEKKI